MSTVVGNLIADPGSRTTANRSAVAQFRIASTPRYLDRQANEWRDVLDGHDLVVDDDADLSSRDFAAESGPVRFTAIGDHVSHPTAAGMPARAVGHRRVDVIQNEPTAGNRDRPHVPHVSPFGTKERPLTGHAGRSRVD